MAGRPRKKPEYNPELQFDNFLQELRDAYEEADSLRSLADELNISLLKLRKLLITADVFTSDICTEINDLHRSGKKIPEIMKLTGLSRASVHSYLPYTKGLYNAAEMGITSPCPRENIIAGNYILADMQVFLSKHHRQQNKKILIRHSPG